jgi:hypothetical protein
MKTEQGKYRRPRGGQKELTLAEVNVESSTEQSVIEPPPYEWRLRSKDEVLWHCYVLDQLYMSVP